MSGFGAYSSPFKTVSPDKFQKLVHTPQKLVIRTANNHQTLRLQPCLSERVLILSPQVSRAVQFDDQTGFGTIEINHIFTNWMLPPELVTLQFFAGAASG